MARLKHYLEYAGSRSIAAVAQSLSAETADRFGASLGTIAYHLIKSRRKISNENIRTTIGQTLSETEIESITRSVFQSIGRTLIEISRFGKLNHEKIRNIIHGDLELFKRIHSEGKGCIILGAHYGNWELLGSWPAALEYKTEFFVGTQHNPLVDAQLNSYRKKLGVGIIPLEHSLQGVFRALKSNHFVCMAADQHAPSGIKLKFLGKEALHARGPAIFSIRTGAPICPIILRREKFDRHVAYACEPIYPRRDADMDTEIVRITSTALKFFEDFIRKYPEQWAWTHRRWKLQSN